LHLPSLGSPCVAAAGGANAKSQGGLSIWILYSSFSPGGDIVKLWKRRVPLSMVATGEHDGRTRSAMRKSIKRMQDAATKCDGVDHPDLKRFKNYDKIVKVAEELVPGSCEKLEATEFEAYYSLFKRECPIVPLHIEKDRFTRAVRRHVDAGNDAELIEMIFPIGEPTGDSDVPSLRAIPVVLSEKIEIFESVLFAQVLVSQIKLGEPGKERISNLLFATKKVLDDIDVMELDTARAKLIGAWLETLHFLIALLQPAVDISEYADTRSKH
jgi:hypothetical protein